MRLGAYRAYIYLTAGGPARLSWRYPEQRAKLFKELLIGYAEAVATQDAVHLSSSPGRHRLGNNCWHHIRIRLSFWISGVRFAPTFHGVDPEARSSTLKPGPIMHDDEYQAVLQDAEMQLLNMRKELSRLNDTLRTRIGALELELKAWKTSERAIMDEQVAALRRDADGILKLPWNPKTLNGALLLITLTSDLRRRRRLLGLEPKLPGAGCRVVQEMEGRHPVRGTCMVRYLV